MKKILLVAILILGVVFYAAVSSFSVVGMFLSDGYVLTGNEVQTNLSSAREEVVQAYRIQASDLIYKRMSTLYVGDDEKTKFNTTYPMYINGGASVLFMDADSILIDKDFHRVEAYDGLVLNEGAAFNEDGTRSDFNDYVFAKLSNGLYINSGVMSLNNLWSKYVVPMNSFVRFTAEDGVSYYGFHDGELQQTIITDVNEDTIVRIGSLAISYRDLLLGLKELTEGDGASTGWQEVEEAEPPVEEIPENNNDEVVETNAEHATSNGYTQVRFSGDEIPAESVDYSPLTPETTVPQAPVKPEKNPGKPVTNPGTVHGADGNGAGEAESSAGPGEDVAGAGEYAVDPEDVMADPADYSPSEYQPGTIAQSAPPAQPAAAGRSGGAGKSATRTGGGKKSKETTSSSIVTGLTKIDGYTTPSVIAGTDFKPGVYTLKTSVSISDPSNVLIGGVTYEITILNDYGSGSLYKRVSVKSEGTEKQTVLISGLQPKSKYMITGTYRFKDEYGRVTTETHIFLESRTFETKDVTELGPIYLEPMMLDTAALSANSVSVPVLKFTTSSDQDAVGSLAKLTVRFNEDKGDAARNTILTEVQLEKVKSYQTLSVSSPKTLTSNTQYDVDIICYDRYFNQLSVVGSHGVSRTCSQVPSAKIAVTPNGDGSNSFTVNVTNPDKLNYTNLKLKIRKSDGTYVNLGNTDAVGIEDGKTTTIPIDSLGNGKNFSAVVFATVDVNDNKGAIERSIGSQQFSTVDISIFGPLYITTSNVTETIVNGELAMLTDAAEIAAKKKELSTRIVLSLKLGSTTNPDLLEHVDVFNIKLATDTDTHSYSLSDEVLAKLLAGEEILFDTNDYTYDAMSLTVLGLKSNTTYNLNFSAAKVFTETGDENPETVSIRVATTLTKVKTFIQEAQVIVNPDTEACYEGFIFQDIKIIDLDGIIGEDYAVLKVTDTDTGKLVGAFQIEKNKDTWFKLRLTADTSVSNGGMVYDIGANKTYSFTFVAENGYPEKGHVTNYLLDSFTRCTGDSLTGGIFSLGLENDRSDSSKYIATFGYTLNVPTSDSFPDSMKQGNVYVDKVLVRDGRENVVETIKLPYGEDGYTKDKVWKAAGEEFSDIAITSADIGDDDKAVYVEPVVPEGYTQLNYVGMSSAYLNTQVLASETIGVEAKVYKTGTSGNAMFLSTMSNAAYANGCGYGLDLESTASKLTIQYGKTSSFNLSPDSSYEISFNTENDRKLYVNDSYVGQVAAPVQPNYVPGEYLFLGAANVASGGTSTANYKFPGRIYYCRIYDGDELLRDYVPAVRNADGVVGFYDTVSETFCKPDSGTLTAGTEMEAHYVYTDTEDSHNENQHVLPDGFTALEYLISDGNQTIDLGYAGNTGRMEYQIKYNKVTTGGNTVPFGASNGGGDWSGLLYYTDASTAHVRLKGSNVVSNLGLSTGLDHEATIIVDNDTHRWESTIDGQFNSATFSGTAYNRTIALFGDHYSNSAVLSSAYQYRFVGRIYYFRMFRNNQLVRDMIPCLNEDGVPGMYDCVTQTFYENVFTKDKALSEKSKNNFKYKIKDTHELSLAVNYQSFTTSVNKKDAASDDSYIFRYYFYYAEGTDYAVMVPLSNVVLTTESEIYTISTGNEFVTKGASNRKYVVIDDIKLDNTNKNTYKLATLRAQIDFQGFTFETAVNHAPIVYTTTRTAKISNLVLKEHVALNKSLATSSYVGSENGSTSTTSRNGGALFRYFYGSCENLYIEYEQEAYPYIYNYGTNDVFWSEIPLSEINKYPEEERKNYKYGFLNRLATFTVDNYGTVDRFVVDLKTDMVGETYMGTICIGNLAGASVTNGYVFSSTGLNSMAHIESVHFYDNGGGHEAGGVVGRNGATSTVSNCYALVDMVYYDYPQNVGGICGRDFEAGCRTNSCYMVGSSYYATTGFPNKAYGPVVGNGVSGAKESDLYYITANTFGYTSSRSTEVSYRALSSEMWQSNILNNGGEGGFLVDDLVAVGCYPLVNWTSNCMPGQVYIPIITIEKSQSSFDIAYSFTYENGIAAIDNNALLKNRGDEAWDASADDLEGYTQLQYIESTGTQYIDTGFIPGNEVFSLSAEIMVTNENDGYLFGAIHETDSSLTEDNKNAYALAFKKVGDAVRVGVGRNWKQTVHGGFSATVKHSVAFTVDNGTYWTRVDSTKAASATYTGMTDHETPVYAFAAAMNAGGNVSAAEKISMRLYSLVMEASGVTVRNMIPVRRNADRVLGMYDKITRTFFPNAGSGTFIAGPECHYLESQDQVVCILLADSDKTRIVYSIDLEGFNLSHDDILYQHKDGSGINSVYVRVHNPERCLSRYVIKSVTFEDDNGNPLAQQTVSGTRYANVEYYKRITTADGGYGTNSWTYMQAKYKDGNKVVTYPENLALYADLDFSQGADGNPVSPADIFYTGSFTGKLKGNGHTMSNVDYDSNLAKTLGLTDSETPVGLFRTVEGSISGLTLDHFQIEGGYNTGALAATLSGALIDDCYVINSYVSGGRLVGGLAADIAGSTVSNCGVSATKLVHNAGAIGDSGNNTYNGRNIGGFTGRMSAGARLRHSFARDIYIETLYGDMKGYAGGFAGHQEGAASEVDSCYATGVIVTNATYTGGLIGAVKTAMLTFTNTYADVDIYTYGSRASGLIGIYASSETYNRVGVAFGSVLSATLLDPVQLRQIRNYDDDRNGGTWYNGIRYLNAGTLSAALYDGSRCYIARQNGGGITQVTDRYTNGIYASAGVDEIISLETYKEGNVFGFTSNDSYSVAATDYAAGELPVLKDTSGNVMPHQGTASVGGTASSGRVGIFVDDSSIELTDMGDGTYTLSLRLYHGSDVNVTGMYTDFSYVDKLCGMDASEGFASLTQGHDLVTSDRIFINHTVNNQTTIVQTGLKVNLARDLYYITAVEYEQDGETRYLKVGKILDIPQQWKTVSGYDEYVSKVMGSHCENFRITGDLNFSGKELRYNTGTSNNIINRMVGDAGFGSKYSDYNKDQPVNNYRTIKGVFLDDTDYGLQEDGCWQRHYFRGLISNVLSEFGCLTIEDIELYGSSARFGLVGGCSGFIYDVNFGGSYLSSTADTFGLFGFISEGVQNVAIRDVTVEKLGSNSTMGTLAGYAKNYSKNNTYNNITLRDCSVSGYDNVGGLIGVVNNAYDYTRHERYRFTNITADNITVSGHNQIGCIFGWMYGTVAGGSVTNSTSVGSNEKVGILTGYSRAVGCDNIIIDNCRCRGKIQVGGIAGFLDDPHGGISSEFVRNCTISNCDFTATGYWDSYSAWRSAVGGIAGFYDYSSTGYIYKNNVIRDCTIKAAWAGAGGIVGWALTDTTANNNTVSRCDIRSMNGSGGLIGSSYYFGDNNRYTTHYTGNHVQDCLIYTESGYAGGFTGNGSRPGANNMVENCWIIAGTDYAGGVTGHMKCIGAGLSDEATLFHEKDDGNYSAIVRNCHVYGRSYVAGGAGYNLSTSGVTATDANSPTTILVDGCDIRGYSYVGGIAGYVYRCTSVEGASASYGASYVTSCYVKDSIIGAPNADVDAEIAARTGRHIGSGGSAKTNTASLCYYGGIVGRGGAANNCLVENCVIGGTGLSYAGAIGGSLEAKYTSSTVSTARGNESKGCVVIGKYYVGGLFGQISPFYPQTYNNTASVTNRITVSDSFSDAKVIGENYVGGIAGKYSNTASTFRHYNDKGAVDYSVNGQYTLPALIKDVTFTGSLEATGAGSMAGGAFGSVSVYTPFADVEETYISQAARTMMQRMVLDGVVLLPSQIKASAAYPLFQAEPVGSGSYGISNLYADSSRQFVVLMNETRLISTGSGTEETVADCLQDYPYQDCVGAYGIMIDASGNRTSSSRFILNVSLADIADDTENLIYTKLLRSNQNMISASAEDSSFGKLTHDDIAEYLPLVKFRLEGKTHKANGTALFGGYQFTAKTADPADGTSYYTLSDISQGLYRPGTASYSAMQTVQEKLYTEFMTTGTIERNDRSADMSAMLAEKIVVHPSAVDEITIEFPADFFTGTDYDLGDYTLTAAKFSTSVEKTGVYSTIATEVQPSASLPVDSGALVYTYRYNFVDKINVLVDYKLASGRSGSFVFVIDPEQVSTGNKQTRNRMASVSSNIYTLNDAKKKIYRDGNELIFSYHSAVPEGYQVLEYLKNDGKAYIDTGYVFKTKPTVICRMEVNTSADTYQLGFTNNGSDYNFQVNIRANSSSHIWYKYGGSGWSNNFNSIYATDYLGIIAMNTPYDWVFSDYITKDNYTFRFGMGNGFASNSQSLNLFRGAGISTCTFYGPVTVYDGDVLVAKLYPVRDPDGKLGMYDVVRKKFYGNKNTSGAFTGGNLTSAGQNYFIHLYVDGEQLLLLQNDGTIYQLNENGTISVIGTAGGGAKGTRSADRSLTLNSMRNADRSLTLSSMRDADRSLTLSSSATLFASGSVSDGTGVAAKPTGSPLYTFQYNGTPIETYGTCSIVGGKISSDFLYYVKSGNLILVDRKLNPVADGIFAHYEGGSSYICVLNTKGELVSLGTVNLIASLKDFRNNGIVSLASNITSSARNLVVEYTDGSMAGYDAVTGECTFRTEGTRQPGIGEYLNDFIDNLFDEVSESLFSAGAVEAASLISYMEENDTTLADLAEQGAFDTEEKYGDFIIGGERSVSGDRLVTGETAQAANTAATDVDEEDAYVMLPDGTFVPASQAQASVYAEGDAQENPEYYIYDDATDTWILVTDDIYGATNAETSGETKEAGTTGKKTGNTITFTDNKDGQQQNEQKSPAPGASHGVVEAEKLLPSEMPQGSVNPSPAEDGATGGGDAPAEAAPEKDATIVDGEGGSSNKEVGEAVREEDASGTMMKKDASQEQYVAILNAQTNSYDIYSVSELMNSPESVKSESSKISVQQAKFLLDKLSAEDEQSASGFSMYALVIGAVVVLVLLAGIVLKRNGKKNSEKEDAGREPGKMPERIDDANPERIDEAHRKL